MKALKQKVDNFGNSLQRKVTTLPPQECGGAIGVVFCILLIAAVLAIFAFKHHIIYYATRLFWFVSGNL